MRGSARRREGGKVEALPMLVHNHSTQGWPTALCAVIMNPDPVILT